MLISTEKLLAIAIAPLGIVHNIVTFMPLVGEGLDWLPREKLQLVTYMGMMYGATLSSHRIGTIYVS